MEKKLLKRIEEMGDGEREKLRELLKDSKSDENQKMKWMYQDKVDSEEYLLGRRIDKAMVEPETTNKDTPGALFSEVISRRSELDMQVKMREDPLYMIRKREEEAKRKLLENPIKMKQLQKVVDEQQSKAKKKKKKVKKKKDRKASSSSDDSDDELLQKYLSIVEQKKRCQSRTDDGSNRSRSESVKRRDAEDRRDVEERDTRSERPTDSRKRHDDDSRHGRKRHDDERHVSRSEHRSKHQRKSSRDRDVVESKSSDVERKSRSRSPHGHKPEGYGLIKRGDQSSDRVAVKPSARSDRKSPVRPAAKVQPISAPTVKRKLTHEEMERKRAEMMSNARERDEQRHKNIEQYQLEDEREKKRASKQVETHNVDFVKPLMVTHASQSSVEDRIKRNLYNIQRTNADLDRNFVRK